ncbi:hypothetical protein [Kitasatospora sp. NPDC088134]|uniref:hypothetical protein n=1 Tax=Kitasatospora sp. NPDC088134 TaxID=3364071 RepID=UPI003817E32C
MLHDCLLLIQELIATVVDQAPEWVELGKVTSPTPEQVRKVNDLHNPAAAPYLFSQFDGWEWLEKLKDVRLLPEEGEWPARPYFERLAGQDPARLVAWLNKGGRLEAIRRAGPAATARLVYLCQRLGGHGAPLVNGALKQHPVDVVRTEALSWAQEVAPQYRDAAWVEATVRALSVGSDGSVADSWTVRAVLAQLLEAGRTGGAQLAQRVRAGLAAVLASYLAVEGVRERLQMSDDLRKPDTAWGQELAGARLAAAACVEFARIESGEIGTGLAVRTGAWTAKALGGWERERLVAVHLLDCAGGEPADSAWWRAAFGVLGRLHTMPCLTPDIGEFVQLALGTCPPAATADLEAALTEGFGPVPDQDALQAVRARLADEDARLADVLASALGGAEALSDLLGEDATDAAGPAPEEAERESALPPVWRTVYCLSPVAPGSVMAPWRPTVDLMAEFTGPPPALTEPLIRIVPLPDRGENTGKGFAARCEEHGVLAGAAELAGRAPSQGHYFDRADLQTLQDAVFADPAAWSADIEGVMAALGTFDLCTVYLQSLHTTWQSAGFPDTDTHLLTAACAAAWTLKTRIDAGDGSTDPDIDERARCTLLHLLRQAWAAGADPGVDETAAVTWLTSAVRDWTGPASVPDNPYITAIATSGGLALVAVLEWAVHRTTDTGHLPVEADTLLTEIVTDGRDDRALAAIGAFLTRLRRHARPWYTAHRAVLLDIAAPPAPIHTWLFWLPRLGADEYAVLGDLDPRRTADYLQGDQVEEAIKRFAVVLLHSPGTFGSGFLAELITGDDGPAAVSALLGGVARATPHKDDAGRLHEHAFRLWDQVLELTDGAPGLVGALAGTGYFGFAEGLDQDRWLARTLRTVTANPGIEVPDRVAERAARSAQAPDALRILTALVSNPGTDFYSSHRVIAFAQNAVDASTPGTEGRAGLGQALGRYAHDVQRATAR